MRSKRETLKELGYRFAGTVLASLDTVGLGMLFTEADELIASLLMMVNQTKEGTGHR